MFLIQDGHQTHTRVEEALADDVADGVVWSPGDHSPASLDEVLGRACMVDQVQAIDPQLYVAPLADANPKKVPDHGVFPVPMVPRDFAARRIGALVRAVLDFQASKPVSHVLSPTVPVSSMSDRWAQIASDLADTALADWAERADDRPLLVTVALEESVLADQENVDALLDELTALECDGFYLLLELDPRHDPTRSAAVFERALYVIHTLAVVNDYELWIGYSGLSGYAMRAAGAKVFATGWFSKQQWWSPSHWTAGGGGRQPRPRIYLEHLLGSLLIDAELQPISRQRRDPELFSDLLRGAGPLAAAFAAGRPFDDDYARADCTSQLFAVCSALDARVSGSVQADMPAVLGAIARAEVLHRRIADVDVVVDRRGGRNALTAWQTAIAGFGDLIGAQF